MMYMKRFSCGLGRKNREIFVAISYGEAVIFCHQYKHQNGECFKNTILEHFDGIFRLSNRSMPLAVYLYWTETEARTMGLPGVPLKELGRRCSLYHREVLT